MTFRIDGVPELERALQQIEKRATQLAITRRALQKAAEPMREMASRYAAVRTGDLSDGIKISARATGEVGRAAYAAVMRKTGGDKIAALSALRTARRTFRASNPPAVLYMGPISGLFYARFVEFGTKAHENGGIFAGSHNPGAAPDPFMRPAFDAEAQKTVDRLAPLIWAEIEKSALRAARKRARANGS